MLVIVSCRRSMRAITSTRAFVTSLRRLVTSLLTSPPRPVTSPRRLVTSARRLANSAREPGLLFEYGGNQRVKIGIIAYGRSCWDVSMPFQGLESSPGARPSLRLDQIAFDLELLYNPKARGWVPVARALWKP